MGLETRRAWGLCETQGETGKETPEGLRGTRRETQCGTGPLSRVPSRPESRVASREQSRRACRASSRGESRAASLVESHAGSKGCG